MKNINKNTHVNGVPLKDPELEEELQFDLPLLKEFLHLSLSLIQLLQDALDVVDGAVVRGLIAGDSRVSAETEGQELLVHTAGIYFLVGYKTGRHIVNILKYWVLERYRVIKHPNF